MNRKSSLVKKIERGLAKGLSGEPLFRYVGVKLAGADNVILYRAPLHRTQFNPRSKRWTANTTGSCDPNASQTWTADA